MKNLTSVLILSMFASSCASTSKVKGTFLRANSVPVSSQPVMVAEKKSEDSLAPPKPRAMKVTKSHPTESARPEKVIQKANQDAKRNPQSDGYFNSAIAFDWETGSLYQIYAAPLRITDISLEPAEKITSIAGGDTVRWNIVQTSSGSGIGQVSHILVKPLKPNLETNIVVTTDRRTYHLEVHSLAEGNYMASVSWNYPNDMLVTNNAAEAEIESDPMGKLSPAQLDFGYHFVAKQKPSWMPLRVFDDGRKTFIEFPKAARSREMPGLFVLSRSGEAEVVNYRVVGDFYVIDRLVDVLELRLPTEVVGIERL